MFHFRKFVLMLITLFAATASICSYAQSFPEGSTSPSSTEIRDLIAGKIFASKVPNGNIWNLEYKTDGVFKFSTSMGFSDTGTWRSEDGKICTVASKIKASCNVVMVKDAVIYFKRDAGDVLVFEARQ